MTWPFHNKPPLGWPVDLDHPLSEGLVGLWLMNEGGGNSIYSLGAYKATGTFAAGAASPSWTAGKLGSAINFDGGDYISLPTSIDVLGQPDEITVVVGLTLNSEVDSGDYIIRRGDFLYPFQLTTASVVAGNKTSMFGFGIRHSGDTAYVYTTTAASWYELSHVAATYKTGSQKIYYNGVLEGSGTPAGSGLDWSGTKNFAIGAKEDGSANFLGGTIEYIYIYNRVLTASEITLLYREPFCMFGRDDVALFQSPAAGGDAGIMTCNRGYWGPTYNG